MPQQQYALAKLNGKEDINFYNKISLFFWTDNQNFLDMLKEEEKEHMEEVKDIVYRLFIFWIFITSIFLFLEYNYKEIPNGKEIFASVIFFVFIGTFTIIFFNHIFIKFHEILFRSQWVFPPDYELIKHYPAEFFQQATILVFVEGIIGTFMYFRILKSFSSKN